MILSIREEGYDARMILLGAVLMTVGALGGMWSAGELTDGIAEIPRHWWSTLAIVPLVAGIVVLAVARTRAGRRPGPSTQ